MLRQQLEAHGQTLFRCRSWLPLFVLLAVPFAFVNYNYPLERHEAQEAWTLVCVGLAVVGQLIRVKTLGHVPPGTSGRNRKSQVADSLNTDGTYSIVRNPLYLGNCLTWLGLAAVSRSFLLCVCIALVFWIYHERVILAEEAFLESRFGESFRTWASQTPVFLPKFRLWRKPTLPFSPRAVVRGEHVNWFILVSAFAGLDILADSAAERRLHIDPAWGLAWIAGLILFLLVRYLRRHTNFFTVSDRFC